MRWFICVLLVCVPVAAQEPEEAEAKAKARDDAPPAVEKKAPAQDPEKGLEWAIDGYLNLDFRYRNADGENDLDIYLHSYVDGYARKDGVTWRGLFNGMFAWRASSRRQPTDFTYNYWDTFNGDLQLRLYEAYAEGTGLAKGRGAIRVGRQFIDEGTFFHVDGARFDFKWENGPEVTLIGGVPVRLSGTSVDSNWMIGVVARMQVATRTRLRLSYYHVDESFPGINFPLVDPQNQPVSIPPGRITDDYIGLTVWHSFYTNLPFFGRFSLLNGNANELHLRLRWFTKDAKWNAFVEWYQLFQRLNNVTNDLTPYVPMLGSYVPFFRLSARAVYTPNDEWIVQGGLAWRQVEDSSEEGTFNHTYGSYNFTVTRTNLSEGKLDITISGVGYLSDQTNDIFVVTSSAVYRLKEGLDLLGGIDYSLYKYLYFNNSESEDVWTYWIRARWTVKKNLRVVGGVSVDDDRFATYTTLFVRVTMRF